MKKGQAVKAQRGHVARLALTPAQEATLTEQGHAARALWNLLHDWWLLTGRCRRSLSAADAVIRQARKEVDWLGVLPAQAAQQVLKTYYKAWVNCWEGRAEEPNFKSRYRSPLAVDVPQGRDLKITRVHRRWGMVNLPKIGRVRFRWTKDLPGVTKRSPAGRVTGARLVHHALGWHIAFRVETTTTPPLARDRADSHVGIDRGITVPLALSDGSTRDHGPWLTGKETARLLRAERTAAWRKKHRTPGERTSRRLHTAYDQIRSLRARAKRRAVDWQHKTTTEIAKQFALVTVEQLPVANMIRSAKGTVENPGTNVAQKAGLNRAITGEAWSRTVQLLAYKLADRGGLLITVPAPRTSQRCSRCHTITAGSRETQARFVCKKPTCGWSGNADYNAACNIDRAGLALAPAAGRAVDGQA